MSVWRSQILSVLGGRLEVFRDRGCEAERFPRGAYSSEVGGDDRVGLPAAWNARPGEVGCGNRCRNGAGADGIRVRTSASTAESGPGCPIFAPETLNAQDDGVHDG